MTKAEVMRNNTNNTHEKERVERRRKHDRYVKKLVDGKIRRAATLGFCCVNIKTKEKYSSNLITELLVSRGFEVTESRKNGRSIFKIKW
jgi:hypothetical protein